MIMNERGNGGSLRKQGRHKLGQYDSIPLNLKTFHPTPEKAGLTQLAWSIIRRTREVRPHRVVALRQAIRQGTYQIGPGRLGAALWCLDDLALVSLLSCHPALIPEYVALYGRNTAGDLLLTLETRDHFTGQHCARVGAIASKFARYLGLPQAEQKILQTAGCLHDLGKLDIPQTILNKKLPLTSADRVIIESHPGKGVALAEPLNLAPQEKAIIFHHHEHWDGRGYPGGLSGEGIPFLCRLVSLADVFDALTSDRPYRRRLPLRQALEIIRDEAGSQFDPHLAREFLRIFSAAPK
ncbi:MAG TPA: HD domain-containing phosphohydrolase [Desulfobaccales bacterium]